MQKIVLTGGIASGKSTVARFFADLGCQIIDADAIAHSLSEPGERGFIGIVDAFGTDVLDQKGRLDRKKLRSLVFSDADKRTRLNSIMHPLVREKMQRQFDFSIDENPEKIIIFDIPLVIETGLYTTMDRIVLVWLPETIQKKRLIARDSLTENEADKTLSAQMNLDLKRKYAHFIIDNSGPLAMTKKQTAKVYHALCELWAQKK